ncbi:MAG: NAD(P)H-hydrate dehydratase [Candidatus Marinimicrobia bacterium]|nr:NAD(P)H-hydrate dehydratase [Candidatus Neomarinimicrobiota bacterium]MBL7046239.1 NAD(P)H-hydrate dehydratase [Candidatus Neomarinimicrobiota bacterium]
MRIFSSREARSIDRHAIDDLGISGEYLMGNAGLSVAEKAMKMLLESGGSKALIIAGKGNNGGDGYVAALKLVEFVKDVCLISTSPKDEIKGDAKIFHDRCVEQEIEIQYEVEPESFDTYGFNLIIDGLLGTGIKGKVKGVARKWIDWINQTRLSVLAIDIPSGISADNGQVLGSAIRADATVTMGFLKQGLVINPGAEYAGEVDLVDIGFPESAFEVISSNKVVFDESIAVEYLKKPPSNTYKHRQGKVFILSGSRGFTGAGCLTAEAALRTGAGLVIAGVPESLNPIFEEKLTEVITAPLPDKGMGRFLNESCTKLENHLDWCDVVAIGPGIGTDHTTMEFVEKVFEMCSKPMVIDADALIPFHDKPDLLKKVKKECILTPHHGEAAAFMGVDKQTIIDDPFRFMKEMVQATGGVVVLKGAPTIVGFNDTIVINSSGHQGLATAGSGDVLTGMIAGFVGQKLPLEIAAQLGVFIHGKAADTLLKTRGYRGLLAGDLLQTIPSIIMSYELC